MKSLRGFTLIELLVVIVILGIVASFAVINIHGHPAKQVEMLAKQFANTLTLAESEALLRSTTLGITIQKTSYEMHEHKNKWQTNPRFRPSILPDGIELTLEKNTSPPQIIISPNGDLTPFTLYITKQNTSARYKIQGFSNGTVHLERLP